jgi:hypothetical protein
MRPATRQKSGREATAQDQGTSRKPSSSVRSTNAASFTAPTNPAGATWWRPSGCETSVVRLPSSMSRTSASSSNYSDVRPRYWAVRRSTPAKRTAPKAASVLVHRRGAALSAVMAA